MTARKKPESVKIRARDVVPYLYGVWCSVGEFSDPFVNQIVHMKWSEDGEYLYLGLETHNVIKARPEEVLELVPIRVLSVYAREKAEEWKLAQQPRPLEKPVTPAARAVACGRWKWLPGALPKARPGQPGFWRRRVEAGVEVPEALVPDFEDVATLGTLWALVREAYRDENKLWGGWVELRRDQHAVFCVQQPFHNATGALEWSTISTGATEVEALVNALEKADADL